MPCFQPFSFRARNDRFYRKSRSEHATATFTMLQLQVLAAILLLTYGVSALPELGSQYSPQPLPIHRRLRRPFDRGFELEGFKESDAVCTYLYQPWQDMLRDTGRPEYPRSIESYIVRRAFTTHILLSCADLTPQTGTISFSNAVEHQGEWLMKCPDGHLPHLFPVYRPGLPNNIKGICLEPQSTAMLQELHYYDIWLNAGEAGCVDGPIYRPGSSLMLDMQLRTSDSESSISSFDSSSSDPDLQE